MSKFNLKPNGDRLLLKKTTVKTEFGGRIIGLENFNENARTAEVVAVGEGRVSEFSNVFIKPNYQVGDVVVYPPMGGFKFEFLGEEFIIIEEKHILLKIEKNEETGE